MDFPTMNMWCWLIPILLGAIFGILGYLIGKGSVETFNNSSELKLLRTENSKLQSDLDACNKKLTDTSSGGKTVSPSLGVSSTATPDAIVFDTAAAKAIYGKTVKKDDLKVIEGIGPKIEQMFHKAGIKTWKTLSENSVAGCQEILNGGGVRYKIHDPASWPMQAKMCYEGKWKELFRWQNEHLHGKL